MTPNELISNVNVGNIVQIVWTSARFDPDATIKPGATSTGVSQIFSCGFVADFTKEYITLGVDALYESGNTEPSFRSTLTVPLACIVSGQVYGKIG